MVVVRGVGPPVYFLCGCHFIHCARRFVEAKKNRGLSGTTLVCLASTATVKTKQSVALRTMEEVLWN